MNGEEMRYDARESVGSGDDLKPHDLDVQDAAGAPVLHGSSEGSISHRRYMQAKEQEAAMRNRTTMIMIVAVLGLMAGCGATARTITAMSQSKRTDVFQEAPGGGSIPAGYADMVIKASMKTPLEGNDGEGSRGPAHGREAYPFLINIDGQAVLWKVEGEKHQLSRYVEGTASHDPEAGEGMKYVLEKKVRLAAGAHKVFFGLPEEPYYVAADITVASGSVYVLEFKPKYWHKHVPTHISTFFKGIAQYEVEFTESLMR